MFRRMFASPSGPLGAAELAMLNRANQLQANGQPALAAPIFARLAETMENNNHPRRAANLHAQAAHAFADAHMEPMALAQARLALNLFIQYQMVERTPVFYGNITRKLSNKGMPLAAETLAKEYGAQVGKIPATQTTAPAVHGPLPTHCPKCGAPLNSHEAQWVDEITVECDFCGASIRVE